MSQETRDIKSVGQLFKKLRKAPRRIFPQNGGDVVAANIAPEATVYLLMNSPMTPSRGDFLKSIRRV